VLVASVPLLAGCGASSNVPDVSSPAAIAATPSPVASPSAANQEQNYAVHLALSGGLATTVTQTKVDANSDCSAGKIDVGIVVNGQIWSLTASVDGYHGPGRYSVGSDFNLTLNSPNYDIWMSTSGSATYLGDTSLSVDVVMTDLMAGPGEPGATAHVSGSVACG